MHLKSLSPRIRIAFATFVGGVSLVVIGCAWVSQSDIRGSVPAIATDQDPEPGIVQGVNDGWISVTGAHAAIASAGIASTAKASWLEKGLVEDKAASLAQDASTVLAAIFAPEFDSYLRHMTERGLFLDKIADGLASAMVEWELYPASIPDLAPERPLQERVRYPWNHPRERNAELESVRPSSLRVGFGLTTRYNSSTWPYAGYYAQDTLFAPQTWRLKQEDGDRLSQTNDSAWIMLECRFRGGMQTRMKIKFYFDADTGVWVPLIVVFGTDGLHRPFPML